jgi:tripartite-type tricarboxylate transporter receptor subunit TctC
MPTIAESGLPGFNVGAWDAIFAPAGTPKAIVDQVNAAIQKALADPELRNQLASRGADVVGGSPQELKTFMAQEIERWGAAVKRSGASVD